MPSYRVQITLSLGTAYLSCACALENGAAHARTVKPVDIEYLTITARTDKKTLKRNFLLASSYIL